MPQTSLDGTQLDRQVQGDFGPMKRAPKGVVGAIQDAWSSAPAGAGVYRTVFSPDEVIRIRIREGMNSTIVLPEWEKIVEEVYGNDFFEQVRRQKNTLTFFANTQGIDGSLTVFGESGRVYVFYVRSESYNSSNISDMVIYVDVPGYSRAAGTKAATLKTASGAGGGGSSDGKIPDFAARGAAGKLRFEFTMSGDKQIAPDTVFTDGRWTYLYFSADRWRGVEFPAVFRVVDRVDVPVSNVQVDGSTLIVKEVGPMTLRVGSAVVCIRPDWAATGGGGQKKEDGGWLSSLFGSGK